MLGPYPVGAKPARRPAGGDPGFERYLQAEYRGGTTVQALQPVEDGRATRVRAAFERFVRQVLFDRRRAKPVPVPMGP